MSRNPKLQRGRERSEGHLRRVRRFPCLICLSPAVDAHHLTYAEPKALGLKVSDRYVVPLCRLHHSELHANGDERLWWDLQGVNPEDFLHEHFGISLPVRGSVDSDGT